MASRAELARAPHLARKRALSRFVGEVPLTQGYYAYVDPEDFDRVMTRCWQTRRTRVPGKVYAATLIDGHLVFLHRFVLGLPQGVEIDHEDGDGLNCRRSNLRPATDRQQAINRRRKRTSKAPYKGLYWIPRLQRWAVSLRINGRTKSLGTYDDAEEAARVYDAWARELYGEFARLNFPEDGEQQA